MLQHTGLLGKIHVSLSQLETVWSEFCLAQGFVLLFDSKDNVWFDVLIFRGGSYSVMT